MKIKMIQKGLKKDELLFASPYGEGKGIWYGSAALPAEEMDVEFELAELLMRWVDIVPADSDKYSIRLERDTVVLTGVLDNIDEDGAGYLRIGESLVMFESLGEPMALGSFVEVRARDIRIYPVVF